MRPSPLPYAAGAAALVVLTLADAGPSFGWYELSGDAQLALGVGRLSALVFLVGRFAYDRGLDKKHVALGAFVVLVCGLAAVVLSAGPQRQVQLISNVPAGEALYAENCAICHGFAGQGTQRGPSLVDDEWLHGSSEIDVAVTIAAGVPGTTMEAWGPILGEGYAPVLAEYVLSLDATDAPE